MLVCRPPVCKPLFGIHLSQRLITNYIDYFKTMRGHALETVVAMGIVQV